MLMSSPCAVQYQALQALQQQQMQKQMLSQQILLAAAGMSHPSWQAILSVLSALTTRHQQDHDQGCCLPPKEFLN